MKALRCLNCQNVVIVYDNSAGYCGKCHIALQEDKHLGVELKLTKDIEQKIIKKKKIKTKNKHKTKHKRKK